MALTSEATTLWFGDLFHGSGTVSLDTSDLAEFKVDWKARSEGEASTTTPEELLGAAHSACFAMAFSNALAENGTTAESLQVTAAVTFDISQGGITGIALNVVAKIPGIEQADFERLAEDAKANCPVSKALTGVPISLDAQLG